MSKKAYLISTSLLFFLFFTTNAFGNIIISGVYQGQNLRISNPVSEDGFGFSTVKIVVNGKIVPLKFDLSEAEIDFTRLGLKPGTKVEIVISYENNETPVIFNPDVIGDLLLINTSETGVKTRELKTGELIPNDDRNRSKY
ncbi:MAG TPA: hypothetical protein VK151_13450 [Fluviicola sp.]|nr:hypothetical protein [Fluviicola sp.]